jgi:hypothetical protein
MEKEMKLHKYCEVCMVGPNEWIAITDESVEISGKDLMETLNYLGEQGWRLVNTISVNKDVTRFYMEKEIADFE